MLKIKIFFFKLQINHILQSLDIEKQKNYYNLSSFQLIFLTTYTIYATYSVKTEIQFQYLSFFLPLKNLKLE